jgi:hypothetical protein
MKYILMVAALLAAISLDAEKVAQKGDSRSASVETEGTSLTKENPRLVVITDAEFVPFSQYFSQYPFQDEGVTDINNLPASSAGSSQNVRASLQRMQHRMP